MRYESTDWAVEIRKRWRHEDSRKCVTFSHPHGVGAFQVSSHPKDEIVTDDDLREFAGHIPLAAVSFGRLIGFRTGFSEHDTFWTKWWLRAGREMIHATYNCPLSERGREDEEVRAMIQSLIPDYDEPMIFSFCLKDRAESWFVIG